MEVWISSKISYVGITRNANKKSLHSLTNNKKWKTTSTLYFCIEIQGRPVTVFIGPKYVSHSTVET